MNTQKDSAFRLNLPNRHFISKGLLSLIERPVENILAISALNRIYNEILSRENRDDFFLDILQKLNISYSCSASDIARIPEKGPIILVSNHPFGGIEGIILASILKTVRPDVRIMANYLLGRIPEVREMMISVDPFGNSGSARSNIRPIKEALRWVKQGGMLVVFPAGEVSHIDLGKKRITDPKWSKTIARMVRITKAPVLPVYFNGANGPLFQVMGLLHPAFRTAMLPRELLNKKNKQISVRIGDIIPFKTINDLVTDEVIIRYLRLRTYLLGTISAPSLYSTFSSEICKAKLEPVAAAQDPKLIAREVAMLPPKQRLIENGEFQVFYSKEYQTPVLMQEIGRLRELTFRLAGEGTGKKSDIDLYDSYYIHLVLWNREKNEIAGAYRLGQTDLIMEKLGKKGLYTSTLFDYKTEFLSKISPALELGRLFIRPEYQKSFSALLLLWKGIGAYVIKNPEYKKLFGTVSINNEYVSVSRQLIVEFLKNSKYDPKLARLVSPRMPFRPKPVKSCDLKSECKAIEDVDTISSLIASIESDRKGIPVMLKQYLKLGGKIIGFNVDTEFSDVLDGLILVDLRLTDPKILERFVGKDGVKKLLT